MYESISKNNELENEMTLDMSYFWYSDVSYGRSCIEVILMFTIEVLDWFSWQDGNKIKCTLPTILKSINNN